MASELIDIRLIEVLTRVNELVSFYRGQMHLGKTPNTTIERVTFIRERLLPRLCAIRDDIEKQLCEKG